MPRSGISNAPTGQTKNFKEILFETSLRGMDKILNGYFYNPTKGNLRVDELINEILRYIAEKPEKFYDIIVGCDSSSGEEPHFPLAVVVLRKGEGGRFFLKKIGYKNRKFYNWKTRVLEEITLSCELALFLRENFEKKLNPVRDSNGREKVQTDKVSNGVKSLPLLSNYQFRYIHADIGENGQTRDMIKEVIGLIRGNGFEAKIKPESFVASTVADRYT